MFAVVCGVFLCGDTETEEFLGVAEVGEASQEEAEQAVHEVLARLDAPPEQLELYPEFFVHIYSCSPLERKMMYQVENSQFLSPYPPVIPLMEYWSEEEIGIP